jgi:hypothetical protein
MITPIILEIVFFLSLALVAFYVALWRVMRQLRPAAPRLDEGLQTLRGGLFRPAMTKGHFHGRPVELRLFIAKWRRTVIIRMACNSPLDFTIWTPGPKKNAAAAPVEGYATLAGPESDQKLASVTRTPDRFGPWIQQSETKNNMSTLTHAKRSWQLELESGTLSWNDYAPSKDEFTSLEFPERLEALASLASSLEAGGSM